jgi:ParB-like chromosome segregation protein Spo0J
MSAEVQFHPLAEAFPLMTGAEFHELVADIEAHGLREPIVLFEGKILDGRNRARACENAGIEPTFTVYQGDDPLGYVISANVHRRHLTPGQKRKLIAKLIKAQPEKSNRQIAKTAKVDDKTVGAVRRRLESTAEIPQLEKTVGADGRRRKQPAKAPKASEDDGESEIVKAVLDGAPDEVVEVLDLVEEVLGDEPLTAKQGATFEEIKKRLKRPARDDAKRDAALGRLAARLNYELAYDLKGNPDRAFG